MKIRLYILFVFLTFLFLFYPGDSFYFHIFAYNREAFQSVESAVVTKINPIPVLKNQSAPDVSAAGVYIADLTSFTPLYEKNSREKLFPASTTKIITALVVNDVYKPDDVLTIRNPFSEGQIMELVQGERISAENLLYGILVHSANDAAYAFADNLGYDKFIALMNEKAKSIHMQFSNFENPAGLDSVNQYTTPYDLALAARELLKSRYLSRFVATKEITIADEDYSRFHRLTNVNRLLGEINGIGGLKTGYTENAGENLVSFYKKNGHQFIIVIMKSEDRFTDTKNVVDWIDSTVEYYSLE